MDQRIAPDEDMVYGAPMGKHRIYRFVDTLLGNTLCRLDKETNVLTIDRWKFDRLTKPWQETVYSAKGDIVLE